MTPGQSGSLLLPCTALSSATPCRFIPALSATLSDPGGFSGAVAITHAYCCLPELADGRHPLNPTHGAQSLHFRCGLSVALSTLRPGRYLPARKTRFPVAGWALPGRDFHPLDEYGFVWAHASRWFK